MNRYDLLVEAYDYFDNTILEMLLADTVETFCIENEGGFEFIEEYINLLESNQDTDEYLGMFSLVISETFANQASPYLGLIYESDSAMERSFDVDSTDAPRPKIKSGLQKFAEELPGKISKTGKAIKDYVKSIPGKVSKKVGDWTHKLKNFHLGDDSRLKPWAQKLSNLKDRLSPTKFKEAIKAGWGRAKKWTLDKYNTTRAAVVSGLSNVKTKLKNTKDRVVKKFKSKATSVPATA